MIKIKQLFIDLIKNMNAAINNRRNILLESIQFRSYLYKLNGGSRKGIQKRC